VKKERRQPRKLPPPKRRAVRERRDSFEAFARLDKSAVIFLIAMFCVLHWAIRVLVSPVFTIEESDQLLMSQTLQLGYEARQPPMLAWLHGLVAMWPGLSGAAVFAIKYVLLFFGLTFYYLAARNVLVKPGVSAAAVAAWGLTFYLGWGVHEDLLGTVGLMATFSLTLHALTRILAWRRNRDWSYFGLAIGLGLLTSHLFIVFPLAILLAIFFTPFFRDAVKPTRLIWAAVVAGAVYAPYLFWLATHFARIGDVAQDFAATWEINSAWLERVGAGIVSLGRAMLEFSLPLVLFWLMLFWPLWLPIVYPVFARRSTDEEPHETAWRRLFARTMLFAAAIFLSGALIGVQLYKGYWMLPVLGVGPIWLFAHVKRAGEFPVAIRAFAAIVIMSCTTVIVGRFVEWRFEISVCDEGGCRPYAPVKAWSEQLVKSGFTEGTIVGADKHLTGNLRALLPHARVIDASLPAQAFPPASTNGACLAVWRDYTVMSDDLAAYLTDQLDAPPRDRGPEGAIRRSLRMSEKKAATLYFQFVPPSEKCR
jgi:hypothetical protein